MKKSLLINIFLIFCFIFSVNNSFAQIQDNVIDDPGDIVILGFAADGSTTEPQSISFVFLDNCPANTAITFTDEEWNGTAFGTGEGDIVWTTSVFIPKGTVVKMTSTNNSWGTINSSIGTAVESVNLSCNLYGTNETLTAFLGTRAQANTNGTATKFLAFCGALSGTNGATLTGTGLTLGTSAKSVSTTITPVAFYRYDATTNGSNCNGTAVACAQMINGSTWITTTTSGLTFSNFGGTVLPIELTTFEGKNNGNQNLLTWRTTSETQNKGFDIERSTDGSRFEKIGFIAGNGTTSEMQRYAFKDDKSPNGIAYYRLKQLDEDGRFEYSKIVAIAQKGDNAVSVFPNPSNGVFTLSGLENIEDEQISIVNSIGQNIAINVQNDGQMDLSAYPSGVYYLRIASSGQVVKLIHQ